MVFFFLFCILLCFKIRLDGLTNRFYMSTRKKKVVNMECEEFSCHAFSRRITTCCPSNKGGSGGRTCAYTSNERNSLLSPHPLCSTGRHRSFTGRGGLEEESFCLRSRADEFRYNSTQY